MDLYLKTVNFAEVLEIINDNLKSLLPRYSYKNTNL
jgi:hypothetical protein